MVCFARPLSLGVFLIAAASAGENETSLNQSNAGENASALLESSSDHDHHTEGGRSSIHVFAGLSCSATAHVRVKKFPANLYNITECLDLCDETPWCNVAQMECGTSCRLYSECSELGSSGCHSYLTRARARDYPIDDYVQDKMKRESNPWSGIIWFQILVAGLMIAVADRMWSEDDRQLQGSPRMDQDAGDGYDLVREEVETGKTPTEMAAYLYDGVDAGEIHGTGNVYGPCLRIGGTIAAYVVLMYILLSTLIPLPDDALTGAERGVCGLVSKDYKPIVWHRLLQRFFVKIWHKEASHDFYFQEGGVVHDGTEFLPMSCWEILNTDLVKQDTVLQCGSFCEKHIGMMPRPFCSMVPDYGPVFNICHKVSTWHAFGWLMQWIPLRVSFQCWLVAFLYGGLSVMLGYYNASDNEVEATREPDKLVCAGDGPFTGRRSLYFCCRHPPNDFAAARRKMVFHMMLSLPDPMLDLNSTLLFFANGQPYYACLFLIALLAPNMHDPLQSTHAELLFTSYKRGFRIRGVYICQKREGAIEATVTLIVALHALMRQSYTGVLTPQTAFTLGLSAMSSFFVALPNAAIARDMLQTDLDFNNYYSIEKNLRKFGSRQYLPALDVLALGSAVARTFTSNNLLARLYVIGFIMGMVQMGIYQAFVKREVPRFRKIIVFVVAFAFWPVSMSRLLADEDLYNSMAEGVARLSDCALHGSASVHPILFYSIRISTLVVFWINSIMEHPHFLKFLIAPIKEQYETGSWTEMSMRLCSVAIIVTGWVSLVLQTFLVIRHWQNFKLIHKAGKALELLPTNALQTKRFGVGSRMFA